jgi:hypothetical protein
METSSLVQFVSAQADAPAGVVDAATACLHGFTAAFNACDTAGMDAHLHFPHLMLSGSARLEWPVPGQHPTDFFDKLTATGWAATRYEAISPVLAAADKVHFIVEYTRRDAQGRELSRHRNCWIVVLRDGRWGIAVRSY